MRIWFDTEFIEDGITIDLLSIGMVDELGQTLYLENSECDRSKASNWVVENVFPHLSSTGVTRKEIADSIIKFVGGCPEFWAYYADYDWVVMCQLFGTMMDLPEGFPMYCRDLKQVIDEMGNPRITIPNNSEHNALSDAIWTKEVHESLGLGNQ